MTNFNRGCVWTLREVFKADGAIIPKRALVEIFDNILSGEEFDELDEAELANAVPAVPAVPAADEAQDSDVEPDPVFTEQVRAYGKELLKNDITARSLIERLMSHFYIPQIVVAQCLDIAPSTLCKYLKSGRCREAVMAGLCNFFGTK